MTTKLNLTNVIQHFASSRPSVASRLSKLAEDSTDEETFQSAFLQSADLKSTVDNLSNKSSLEEFNTAKDSVRVAIELSDKFSAKKKVSTLAELETISRASALQRFFYNYILAAEGLKRVSNIDNTRQIADTLIEVANQLDRDDPELAKEADALLDSLVKQAQMGEWESDWTHEEAEQSDNFEHEWDSEPDYDFAHESAPEEIVDPELEDPTEESECDHISIADLEDRLANMKWRLTDKSTKERYQKALEHAHRAKQYLDAHKKYKDVAHSIFDKAGDKLRFKFD